MHYHVFSSFTSWRIAATLVALLGAGIPAASLPAPSAVEITLEPVSAQALRLVVLSVSGGNEPCIDELEAYGPGSSANLASASAGAVASASSCLTGYAAHAIEHLNDGQYGNAHSWIPAEAGGGWAQIDFTSEQTIDRVVFSRDRQGQYADRKISAFRVEVRDSVGQWHTVAEERVYAIDLNDIHTPPRPPKVPAAAPADFDLALTPEATPELLEAFLLEEYAWLMAHGRADFNPAVSQPRYGMERPGPRHADDDHLPLPQLAEPPTLDGVIDDAAWGDASRGVARVAALEDFTTNPLVEYAVQAGIHDDTLYMAVHTSRLLSRHVALVSAGDWNGCGAVVFNGQSLTFEPSFGPRDDVDVAAFEGAANACGDTFEFKLPLDWFKTAARTGIRVGLGLGGKYTAKLGRPVTFSPAPFAIAARLSPDGAGFLVTFANAATREIRTIETGATAAFQDVRAPLSAGTSADIHIASATGPLGPEATCTIDAEGQDVPFRLHLLHYAPAAKPIAQAKDLYTRLAARGIDVTESEDALATLVTRHAHTLQTEDAREQRQLLLDARLLKRALFLSDPALEPARRLLFVKRYPFRPSHNYSVILDAPWNPGGAVCLLDIPSEGGRLRPGAATLRTLFDAGDGLARTPMADFACENVYFAYKPTKDGYFHLQRINLADGGVTQISDGPFHDYWPCPLPDGDLAFISTRCRRRFLCWRPQAATLHRMNRDGGGIRVLSHANLTEWAPSVMDDGRIIWTRSEYQDKSADFGHTLWAIRPDGTAPELVFGNTITKTNGYANGRFIPGTNEVVCTLISHFGDLNGPIARINLDEGRFNAEAIASMTPEVFWPGSPMDSECFRDPVPIGDDLVLCSHAGADRFDLFVIDRHGNREYLYGDQDLSSMCPTPFAPRPLPPTLPDLAPSEEATGEFVVADVYQGLAPEVQRGEAAYLAVSVEVTHDLEAADDGVYRADYEPFQQFYASPSDVLSGPYGWPTYAVKERLGLVPIEPDGSAYFKAPSGQVLFFHVLDKDFNELQRMRSVLQLQPGEQRSCIGCHENRSETSAPAARPIALERPASVIAPDPWGTGPFSYEAVVQPVLDMHCVRCHNADSENGLDFTSDRDANKIPASYRTFIEKGLVHYADWTWSNPDVCALAPPKTLGTLRSKLFHVLEAGHHDVNLPEPAMRALKTWVDLNCPLWSDYTERKDKAPARPDLTWTRLITARAGTVSMHRWVFKTRR